MDWRGAVTTLGGATLAVLAMLGGAAAQSDGSDGRPYMGRPQPQPLAEAPAVEQRTAAEQPAPRSRRARTELSRGAKNIPWDEPGKLSGVPGVMENSATDLPSAHSDRPARKAEKRRVRTAAEPPPRVEHPAPARARPERSAQRPDLPADALGYTATRQEDSSEPRKVPVEVIRVPAQPPQAAGARAETPQPASDAAAAEARARLIEQFRAKALAEEQHRLQAEQSRDRHARRADPVQTAQPRAKGDPEVTGAVTTASETSSVPEQKTSGLKQGVCRMLLFNLVPGC